MRPGTATSPALAVRIFGTGRPIAALHGFTLTGAQFAALGGAGLQIHGADLPGHGRTRIQSVDIPTTIAAAAEWLASFDEPVPLLGYSQGGRIALLTALEHPDLVERLVLISTSPGIEGDEQRRKRRESDEILAAHIEEIGVGRFLDEWLDNPVTAGPRPCADSRRADRTMRSGNTASGLAAALRGLGQGSQPYVGNRIHDLAMPLLTISGRLDTNYQSLAETMAAGARDGRHVSVEGSGHNVVRDAPWQLLPILTEFCLA